MAHKVPRKSTSIDMTAMCDVAFLLLTFFMLATKFKPAEAVVVRTPSSVADIPLPDNAILLTVDKDGKIFMDYDNKAAKAALIDLVDTAKQLGLSAAEKESFVKGASIGASYANLKTYLAASQEDKKKLPNLGIPCDTTFAPETNELAYWLYQARVAGLQDGKQPIICIKSDAGLQYPGFKNIVRVLTKNEIFTFNLLTSSEQVPEGTALYDNRVLGNNAKK
jgi:biopolymer transport protein ExbD